MPSLSILRNHFSLNTEQHFSILIKASEQETPVGKPLLNKDLNEVPHRYSWEYRGAIDIDIAGYVGFFCVVKKGSKRQTCVCQADMSADLLPTRTQKLSKRAPTLSNRDADADMLV